MNLFKNTLSLLMVVLGITISKAQSNSNVINNKVILSSRIENGNRIQKIKEGEHEYILSTPLELIAPKVSQSIPEPIKENVVFKTNANYIIYTPPEIQTPELIKERLMFSDLGLPLDYNSQVQKEVMRMLRNRDMLENALGRSQYFMVDIENVIRDKNMPEALKYLPLVESAYKPKSHSRAGAKGIWQFMKATGRMYKLKVNANTDERLNPELSTRAATTFLGELYNRFGDWHLALAAYNCGPGRVQRAINASGIENPTFWEIQHLLPRETKRYIPKFIAATYIMHYSNEIGLLPNIDGYELARAQCEQLVKDKFKLKTNTSTASSKISPNSTLLTYTVKSGDNIGFIAEWYDTSAKKIRGWNNISGNLIKPGQKLKVYVPKSKKELYAKIDKVGAPNKTTVVTNAPTTLAENNSQSRKLKSYTVRKGDTLWDISRKNGMSISELRQINNISRSKNLMPGMVIKIREKS